MKIDPQTVALPAEGEALFLGLLRKRDESLRLVVAGRDDLQFPTHQAMIDAGTIVSGEWRGFSMLVRGGKVAWFQRQSCLNTDCRGESLSIDMMDRIILELLAPRRDDFVSFGDDW